MKKFLSCLTAFVCFLQIAHSQSFYDIDDIQVIELTFAFNNWDYRLDTAKNGSEGYIMASSCKINGEVFDSVGVKYKGNSSYDSNNAKNPFHIELDTYIDQDYNGYTDIKLGNGFADPSMVREVLSYEIIRKYMDAPLSNFAKVYVNGAYLGLYASSEHIGKRFAASHFNSSHNTLVKCNPQFAGGGPGGSMGAADLRYLSANPSSYATSYELKSDDPGGWYDLINLCDTLNNHTNAVEQVLDIDRAIWMLAFNNVLVNLDSYTGGFRQNYYLYLDDNGRFVPIVWDLNMSFGGFPNLSASGGGPGAGLSISSMKTLALSANSTSSNHPLIQKIWNNLQYRRMYIAHAKTIVEENFADSWYYQRAQELQDIIEADVLADNNKFYSNANFYGNLTSDVSGGGVGGSGVPGLTNLMNARTTFLNSTTEFGYTAPVISNISLSDASPDVFEQIWVTATIQEATQAWLGYRSATPKAFTKLQMYDDGAHQDGAAGDKVFGVLLPLESARTEYYIYAENANAGKFSPVRAEHEFYTIEANVPTINTGEVVVNEFVANNQSGVQDANGEYADWIELYNNGSSPRSLKGLYLSNNANDFDKWQFPDYAVVPANGYLAIWCDDDEGQSGLHTNFKLSAGGADIRMSYSASAIVEDIEFDEQVEDGSSARCPNGNGDFLTGVLPTYMALNTCVILSAGEENEPTTIIKIFPNPASANVWLSSEEIITSIDVLNLLGQPVLQWHDQGVYEVNLDCSGLAAGIYIAQINKKHSARLVMHK